MVYVIGLVGHVVYVHHVVFAVLVVEGAIHIDAVLLPILGWIGDDL
jgi:hypothetical protein